MTEAIAGYGSVLRWHGKPIAEVSNITGPGLTIDQIDCTHYTSPQQFKEFIAGFGDGGEVTLDCNLIPGDTEGQVAFIEDAYAKEVRDVEIDLGDPVMAVWSFDGMVTKLDFTQPMDGKIGFSASIKVSGVPGLAFEESLGLSALVIATLVDDMVPIFNNAIYVYTCGVAAATTTITVTATELTETHIIRCRFDGGDWIELVTAEPKAGLVIGADDTVTKLEVNCYEVDKIAKTYIVYIARPTL